MTAYPIPIGQNVKHQSTDDNSTIIDMSEKGFIKRLSESPFAKAALVAGAMAMHEGQAPEKEAVQHGVNAASAALERGQEQGPQPLMLKEFEKIWGKYGGSVYLPENISLHEALPTLREFAKEHGIKDLQLDARSVDADDLEVLMMLPIDKITVSMNNDLDDQEAETLAEKLHEVRASFVDEGGKLRISSVYRDKLPHFEMQTASLTADEMVSVLREANFLPDVTYWQKFPMSLEQFRSIIEAGDDMPKRLTIISDGLDGGDKGPVLVTNPEDEGSRFVSCDSQAEADSFVQEFSSILKKHTGNSILGIDKSWYKQLVRVDASWNNRNDVSTNDVVWSQEKDVRQHSQ